MTDLVLVKKVSTFYSAMKYAHTYVLSALDEDVFTNEWGAHNPSPTSSDSLVETIHE